ncbi:MAG TPA: helix-turn-helix domain-containing protein [Pyrinomonadaceae bacterium]|nr:helix-turn-helix domain-containing protein [Pyrinomonadaceae bacterium]
MKLSSQERKRLQAIAGHTTDAHLLRRAQALLWLASEYDVEDITQRLGISRRTIYYWIEQYESRDTRDIVNRLSPLPRSGRPRTAHGIIDPLIDMDPRELGYRSTVWTATLLREHLSESHQLSVSARSVSYALARLGLRWKRPRHQLALRARHWRQAKGG